MEKGKLLEELSKRKDREKQQVFGRLIQSWFFGLGTQSLAD